MSILNGGIATVSRRSGFAAILLACLALFATLYHFSAPKRSLMPPGFPESQSASSPLSELQDFFLPISPAFETFHGVMIHRDLKALDRPATLAGLEPLIRSKPQWFPRTIGLRVAAEDQQKATALNELIPKLQNNCGFTLVLSAAGRSSTAQCIPEKDAPGNLLIKFSFDAALVPAVYTANIEWMPHTESLARLLKLQLLVPRQPESTAKPQQFAEAYSQEQRTLFEMLKDLAGADLKTQLFLSLSTLILIAYPLLVTIISLGSRIALLLLAVASGLIAFTPSFSGNDETAHLHYAIESHLNGSNLTKEEAEKLRKGLYADAREELRQADFYRLHNVGVVPEGKCPHVVVTKSCGSSAEAIAYYEFLEPLQRLFFRLRDPSKVSSFLEFGVILNVGLLVFVMAVAALVLSANQFTGFALLVLLVGGGRALLPSLSNDFPVHAISLLTLVFFLGTLRSSYLFQWEPRPASSIRLRWLYLVCCWFCAFLASKIDVIGGQLFAQALLWTVTVPILFGLGQATRTVQVNNAAGQSPIGLPNRKERGAISILRFAGFLSVSLVATIATFWCARIAVGLLAERFSEPRIALMGRTLESKDLASFAHPHFIDRFLFNLRSLIGTHNWDHSHLPVGIEVLVGSVFMVTVLFGLFHAATAESEPQSRRSARLKSLAGRIFFFAAIGAAFGTHLTLLAAIPPHGDLSATWTFSVWRLYSPGVVSLGIVFAVGVEWLLRKAQRFQKYHSSVTIALDVAAFSYAAMMVFYGLPSIYWISRY